MQTSYYIYVYLDPRRIGTYTYGEYSFEHEPFYIGKGKNDRVFDHLKEVRLKHRRNLAKCNKIEAIYKENKIPIILKIKEELSNNISNKLERKIIKTIGRLNLKTGPLTNITDGGDTFSNNPHKELTRKKMSIRCSGRGNPMYGKHHTKETILKISKNRKGKRKGVKTWNTGKKMTSEYKRLLKEKRKNCISGMAKKFKLISPENEVFEIKGKLENFCKIHKLSHMSTRFYSNKGKVPPARKSGGILRNNLTGWTVIDLGYINKKFNNNE